MDLQRHLTVLWRHRRVVAGGLVLGLVTAFLAAYQPGWDGGPALDRRGQEQWSSSSRLFVTQEGFPWGRVTLPVAPVPGQPAPSQPAGGEGVDYGDPTRFSSLAMLYSVLSNSDRVREALPGNPAPSQIQAFPYDPTGRGDQLLPIIQVTTMGASAQEAVALNRGTVAGLRELLVDEQERNRIPADERVRVEVLNEPEAPVLLAGRSVASSLLAFVLCAVAAVALAHLLEGLAPAGPRRRTDGGDGSLPLPAEGSWWVPLPRPPKRRRERAKPPGGQANGNGAAPAPKAPGASEATRASKGGSA